ncbi:mechanosensitive ion channel family protein [Seonamhaeicola sp. ML3]|uniref:mechanosensitive ion channel family protein n=1 Tax=Seonamhaeicola sp. ML3 TaxID=2937786 RepID=UPI002010C4C0|nr:mechanosensitive ion channel family protein [Seonamhaeicola sp. ML3]
MSTETKIGLILVLLATLVVFIIVTRKALIRFSLLKAIEPNRRKIVGSLIYFTYYIIALFILLLIIGIEFNQFMIFASSILAVLGVGFFAQWSLLSNLTTSMILFFFHPLRIGSHVRIIDKELDLSGQVIDITGFYVLLKKEDNKIVSIPNSVIINKGIEFN